MAHQYMRKWLRGRASPCQGYCRGFESRLPLQSKNLHCIILQWRFFCFLESGRFSLWERFARYSSGILTSKRPPLITKQLCCYLERPSKDVCRFGAAKNHEKENIKMNETSFYVNGTRHPRWTMIADHGCFFLLCLSLSIDLCPFVHTKIYGKYDYIKYKNE